MFSRHFPTVLAICDANFSVRDVSTFFPSAASPGSGATGGSEGGGTKLHENCVAHRMTQNNTVNKVQL